MVIKLWENFQELKPTLCVMKLMSFRRADGIVLTVPGGFSCGTHTHTHSHTHTQGNTLPGTVLFFGGGSYALTVNFQGQGWSYNPLWSVTRWASPSGHFFWLSALHKCTFPTVRNKCPQYFDLMLSDMRQQFWREGDSSVGATPPLADEHAVIVTDAWKKCNNADWQSKELRYAEMHLHWFLSSSCQASFSHESPPWREGD